MKRLISGILMIIAVNVACAMQPAPTSGINANNNIDSILEQVELIPIMINGDKNNRINIVIMNRWTSK